MHRQDSGGLVRWVTPQSSSPGQGDSEFGLGIFGGNSEAFDKPLQGVPGQPRPAVVALSGRSHRQTPFRIEGSPGEPLIPDDYCR
jgi:hypothetical protein